MRRSRSVSDVAVESGTEDDDPDGLDHQARMNLEAVAIARILKKENALQTTPPGNEGFDLLELDASGEPERWIEVKAMSGSLEDRPVECPNLSSSSLGGMVTNFGSTS